MVGGLKYNDVNVQLASVYTCVQLYSQGPAGQSSQMVHHQRVTQKLVHDLLHVLEQTSHSGLISSLVGLYTDASSWHCLWLALSNCIWDCAGMSFCSEPCTVHFSPRWHLWTPTIAIRLLTTQSGAIGLTALRC